MTSSSTGASVTAGSLYIAPLGATEPTAVSGAWPTGWNALGYTDQGSPTVSPTTVPAVTSQQAITAYLAPYVPGQPTSFLAASMRDAEAAINAGALWLGTLGYLVTVEQVGHCVRLKGATNRSEKKYRAIFTAACADFGDTAVEKNERNLLYDVRCALAHEFSLSSQKNQFIYSRGLKLLQGAAPRPITVCLDAVWKYVNDLVDQLRTEHDNGNVTLVNTMTPQGLLTMRFEIRP